MDIPHNSLTEDIKEIVALCEELAPEYGEDASWFSEPASEDEIIKWEHENKISIPSSYKEWLSFTNESQIRNTLAHFYGPNKFGLYLENLSRNMVVIADLIGDGEQLCFSKTTGNFIWIDHDKSEVFSDFSDILNEIIRLLRSENTLSPKMEKLLMKMVEEENKCK